MQIPIFKILFFKIPIIKISFYKIPIFRHCFSTLCPKSQHMLIDSVTEVNVTTYKNFLLNHKVEM